MVTMETSGEASSSNGSSSSSRRCHRKSGGSVSPSSSSNAADDIEPKEGWFHRAFPRVRWVPTSPSKLKEAEEKLLGCKE